MNKTSVSFPGMTFEGYSIAGKGSSLYLLEKKVMFDYGVHDPRFLDTKWIFLSHIHSDHMVGLFQLLMSRMNGPKLFVICPEANLEALGTLIEQFCQLTACPNTLVFYGVIPGTMLTLSDHHKVLVRPVQHLAPDSKDGHIESVGYTLFETRKVLKEEYKLLPREQIVDLGRQGVELSEERDVNLVTYIGDSMVETYSMPENQDIADSQVVFLEATHIGLDEQTRQRARSYGHTDLAELPPVIHRFQERNPLVKTVLKHFSAKYNQNDIEQSLSKYKLDINVECFASND